MKTSKKKIVKILKLAASYHEWFDKQEYNDVFEFLKDLEELRFGDVDLERKYEE